MAYETPYTDQWLKVATNGNVVCKAAWYQNRVQFSCLRCDQSLTTTTDAVKSDDTVDYSLQEFVKIHAHTGGHVSGTTIKTATCNLKQVVNPNTGEMELVPVDYKLHAGGIPMTVDFKKIDLMPEKGLAIKKNLKAYNETMDKALDETLAAKIAELRAEDKDKALLTVSPGKIINVNKLEYESYVNGGATDAELVKAKAIENVLKITELQKTQKAEQIEQHQRITVRQPKPKDKVLTQPTGRKFR